MARNEHVLDKNKIKKELEQKQTLEIQKQLTKERRKRLWIMVLLLSALCFTIIFGTLENPFQWTFSKIGNRFNVEYRVLFIVWAGYTGFSIQASILALMSVEKYQNKNHYMYVIIGVIFLAMTSIAPSLPDDLPFWYYMHLVTSGLFALLVTMGFYPFIIWVARENPRLRRTVYVWLSVTWGGSIVWYFTLGNTGMFEIWFFTFFIIFLLYLSLTLFEEKIVKLSIHLLKDEDNLNQGIEKIFINLEEERRSERRKKKKKRL